MQNAREHFDGGGFARTVGTDEAEHFARVHLEREAADCFDGTVLRLEQCACRGSQPCSFAFGLKGFVEVGYFDGRHVVK